VLDHPVRQCKYHLADAAIQAALPADVSHDPGTVFSDAFLFFQYVRDMLTDILLGGVKKLSASISKQQ